MKEIAVTFTILRTVLVPDDFQQEDVEIQINEELLELGLDKDAVNDIEWEVFNR